MTDILNTGFCVYPEDEDAFRKNFLDMTNTKPVKIVYSSASKPAREPVRKTTKCVPIKVLGDREPFPWDD